MGIRHPSEKEALGLLVKHKVPEEVILHSFEVRENAIEITRQLQEKGHTADAELLKVAALLHDIGRAGYPPLEKMDPSKEFHVYDGWKLLREIGYPELAEVCVRHGLCVTREESKLLFPGAVDTIPRTLEEKILCISDRIRPGRETLEEFLEGFRKSKKLDERYFNKAPQLKEVVLKRVIRTWKELRELGMRF